MYEKKHYRAFADSRTGALAGRGLHRERALSLPLSRVDMGYRCAQQKSEIASRSWGLRETAFAQSHHPHRLTKSA